ncbi:hypothetical protein IBG34_23760 (plasmid) [Aeromonas media]|nr:hypothetical protein IBG34_23760 [Aeromonas media]
MAKAALAHNAAAVILAHNHPSGLPIPSATDKQFTAAWLAHCSCLRFAPWII